MRTVTTWSDLLHPGDAASFFDRSPLPVFEPGAVGYSASNAWWLAELSRLVYRHDVEEDAKPRVPFRSVFLAKAGLRQRLFFDSPATGTQGFIVESIGAPAFAALVFRGTEQTPKDFLEDLDAIQKPLGNENAEVHEGFLNTLNSVWEDRVAPELDKLTVPVFFTGHSLGAALATVAASRRPPAAVYTFGSPLVGNAAFAETVNRLRIYRVVDDSDVVTTVPPAALGFRHVGELRRLTPPLVQGFRFDPFAFFRPPKPLADHAPINYVERVL
jgi:hypothetical protein